MPEILVEVTSVARSGDLRPKVSIPEEFDKRAEEVGQSIADVATKLRGRLESALAEKPTGQWALTETSVTFGVSLQTEAGVVVARAQAGATFDVTLRWAAPGG